MVVCVLCLGLYLFCTRVKAKTKVILYRKSILNAGKVSFLMFQITLLKMKCQNMGEIMFHCGSIL